MYRTRLNVFLCCVLLCAGRAAIAAPEVYVDRVEPLAYEVGGVRQGLLFDLLSEMGQRVHHPGPVVPMPLVRQRFLLKQRDNALGTLWRVPELETSYSWWCKLFEASFYMVAAPGSSVDISSVKAAKHLRVGVILGSPAEQLAQRMGFQHIESSATAESNARKLALGRIDIWIATPLVVKAAQARVGQALANPRISHEIGKLGLYLASSPRFDRKEAGKWKLAFESMQKDGSYAVIKKKYAELVEFQP